MITITIVPVDRGHDDQGVESMVAVRFCDGHDRELVSVVVSEVNGKALAAMLPGHDISDVNPQHGDNGAYFFLTPDPAKKDGRPPSNHLPENVHELFPRPQDAPTDKP